MDNSLSEHFLEWAGRSQAKLKDKAGRTWSLECEKMIGVTYWACEESDDCLFLSYNFEGEHALTGYFTKDSDNEGVPVQKVPCNDVDNLNDLTKRFLSSAEALLCAFPQEQKAVAKRKVSIYLPDQILEEVKEQSLRQDRSVSWLLQRAWKLSKSTIQSYPVGSWGDSDPK
jgi:uncharacterized small protein (TIGR04563 family)